MVNECFDDKLMNLINSGFPYLYLTTYEESRAQNRIVEIVQNPGNIKTPRAIYTWTQTVGMVRLPQNENENPSIKANTKEPMKLLDTICKIDEAAVFILKDMHIFFGGERGIHPDYLLIRKFRDIMMDLQTNRKNIIFLSPSTVIPNDLEKDISVIDFNLPDEREIRACLDELCASLEPSQIEIDEEGKNNLARAALGLTLQEAENAFCRAIVSMKGLYTGAIDIIFEEKNQVVKKTGVLEFIKSDLNINDIGGLDNLKQWLLKRNLGWGETARKYNIPAPKGVLITGVPGCGKSLTAKAMSSIWGLPLLKLDMGRIFGGIVGSSEENMRSAIATAEAISPSILWVDEIEKGFSGIKSGGDAGTTARVFGTFLTWLQEKTKPVFVVATANDISALPAELLRKGRFDEIFFVDLPTMREREKIIKLHLEKRVLTSEINHEISIDEKTLKELAMISEGLTGSEIEQVVISALYEAFYMNRGLEKNDLILAMHETVPLSKTQSEQILMLRKWAMEKAVLATATVDMEEVNEDIDQQIIPMSNVMGERKYSFDL